MAAERSRAGLALSGVLLLACACAPAPARPGLAGSPEPVAAVDPPPALPPSTPPSPTLLVTTVPVETTEARRNVRSVTLSAADADVRALLPALAEAADLSLVMGPQVEGRVTVNLVDLPADEALRLVLAEAGLMIEQAPFRSPWAPVVFYALPINIDTADSDLMRERYHISPEMAQWLVDTRIR
jgi:hypothetical protein